MNWDAIVIGSRDGRVFVDPSRLTAGGPGWDPLLACRRLGHKPRARARELRMREREAEGALA